ncbi:MAG TPA: SHOCT domain-containing protein [Actinomycetota bacterium]
MQNEPLAARPPQPVGGSVLVFIGLAGLTAGLTVLYLGMRAVMEIGGFCAEGGPFVIEHHCPQGVAGLMMGGIWGGLIFAGLYGWQVFKHSVPSFLVLLWPALFLSLGWNFLEFGLNPPGGGGLAWGWLVCAIVFGLMGGLPLIWALKAMGRRFRGEEAGGAFGSLGGLRGAKGQLSSLIGMARKVSQAAERVNAAPGDTIRVDVGSDDADTSDAGSSDDMVSALERLDALRRSGALDEAEYAEAKRRILEGGSS